MSHHSERSDTWNWAVYDNKCIDISGRLWYNSPVRWETVSNAHRHPTPPVRPLRPPLSALVPDATVLPSTVPGTGQGGRGPGSSKGVVGARAADARAQ